MGLPPGGFHSLTKARLFPIEVTIHLRNSSHDRTIVNEPISEIGIWCDRMVDYHALPASRVDFYWEGTGRDITKGSPPTCRSG
jgi:hypothetical protein